MELEICVDSVESAIAAARGGADRVELCSALEQGGITPSIGLIRAVRSAVSIDVFVLIRPRGGDFVYTDHEFEVMREDIRGATALGANGVVLGILTPEGGVDQERTRSLIDLARPLQVTFHRAFDFSTDLEGALEEVIACGADRLLTSGGKPDAKKGVVRIGKLCRAAGDRIRIMAGGGIRESNVRNLALRTGIREVHTSLSTRVESTARHGNPGMYIGSHPNQFARFLVMEQDVRDIKFALDSISLEKGAEVSIQ
jgi:copper homeostasis protein